MRDNIVDLMYMCNVPTADNMHPLAQDAFVQWVFGVLTDFEMLWLSSLVDSTNITWAECLIKFAGSMGA